MPHATVSSGASNELVPGYFDRREEEEPSAGTSFSTSESKPGKSGSSGTPVLPSPAPAAESPSDRDLPASTAPSSSVSSTDGSTQETGYSPVPQPDSSEASAPVTPVTPDQVPELEEAAEVLSAAHAAYRRGELDLADKLLGRAESLDGTLAEIVATARGVVNKARAAQAES
jgi:hypothetical protein